LIVIGVIVFGVMSYIAYRKREAIKVQGARLSAYARRKSQQLRASFSGRGADAKPDGTNDKANPVNSINKDMMEMQDKAATDAPADPAIKKDDAPAAVPVGAEEEHNFDGAQAQGDGKVADDLVAPDTVAPRELGNE
jgi:hypothetical protein|tara:strand:+ start:121 stop:531 length:411 start_codon:yes stop_codon:yes gene_type:complete